MSPAGRDREVERDLPLVRRLPLPVEEGDLVPGHGPPHRAGLDELPGGVADLGGGLGLAVAVPDGRAPALADLLDHLGVERLPGGERLAHPDLVAGQVLEDEHAPHRGRRAHRGDLVGLQHLERPAGHEAGVVVDEDRGPGVEGGEEARPGVLGPPRRADVHVDVPLPDPDPVHGGEVADRVAALGVQHELRLRGGPAREVEQHRVVDVGLAVRDEVGRLVVGVVVGEPAAHLLPDHDAGEVPRETPHLLGSVRVGDDVAHLAPLQPVLDVLRGEERGGRDEHRAELHGAEHDLPEGRRVGEHHEDAVAPLDALAPQVDGDAVRALGQLVVAEADLGPVLLDDVEGGAPVAVGDDVEPVERPVEAVERRPAEALGGCLPVLAVLQQEVAGAAEVLGGIHEGLSGAGRGTPPRPRRS